MNRFGGILVLLFTLFYTSCSKQVDFGNDTKKEESESISVLNEQDRTRSRDIT